MFLNASTYLQYNIKQEKREIMRIIQKKLSMQTIH